MLDIPAISRSLLGVNLTEAQAEQIIAMVKSRVRILPKSHTIRVTVSVSSDDLLDVLAWNEGKVGGWVGHAFQPLNSALLRNYSSESPGSERRESAFLTMPASLQWAVHEYEKRGPGPLRDALDTMGVPSRPLTDGKNQ
ncbi:hypothetical protein BH09ACT9_BH09ACT9_00370 [soil metagenome]